MSNGRNGYNGFLINVCILITLFAAKTAFGEITKVEATGDFNGDGYDDLAVSDYTATVAGREDGLSATGQQFFTKAMLSTLSKAASPVEAPVAAALPTEFKLLNNYPNPFNPSTRIAFQLPQDSNVRIDIYNMTGQLVRRLTGVGQSFPAGEHQLTWNGKNDAGDDVSSGIYLYRMSTAGYVKTHKMTLMR